MSTQVLPEVRAARGQRVLGPYYVAAGCVAASCLLYHLFLSVPRFPLDDPYITLHSAQVLHWGFDPNYPGVSPLYGATSAPFLALVYVLLFFLKPLWALETAGWLGILAYVLGLVYLTRSFRLSRFASLAIIALGLTSSFIPVHLLNGLETAWAMACVIWALSLGSDDRPLLAALVAGFAAAIRPDLLPFTLMLIGALAVRLPRAERLRFLLQATVALVPIALCSAWYFVQTGYAYPLTGITKRYYMASAHLPLASKLGTELLLVTIYLISCGPLVLGLRKIRDPLVLAVAGTMLVSFVALYIQFPDGMGANCFRYPIVFTPMLVWSVAALSRDQTITRLLVISLIFSIGLTFPYSLYIYLKQCRNYDAAFHQSAQWCEKNLPGDARIMVVDAGYMAYATKFRILDCAGLKTPEAIKLNREYTWPSNGDDRARAMGALALKLHGTYLINLRNHSALKNVPSRMQALGWKVELLKEVPVYSIYRISPPAAPSAR